MADKRYHVILQDDGGDELPLMLVESPQLGFSRRLVNPYAAKAGAGSTQDSDLTEWSVWSQRDWHTGRGQEEMEDGSAFLDGWNVETRIKRQLTLGPLPQAPTPASAPVYEPGNVAGYGLGRPGQWQRGAMSSGIYWVWAGRVLVMWIFQNNGGYLGLGGEWGGLIKSLAVGIRKVGTPSAGFTAALHAHNGSFYGAGAELASVTVAAGDVGTSFDWVTCEFASPLAVDSDTVYWERYSSTTTPSANRYEKAWGGSPGYSWPLRVNYEVVSRAQSFTTPGAGLTCESVQLYVRKMGTPGTFTVKLCADDGGKPGTVLKSESVDVGAAAETVYGWLSVTWGSGEALAGSTLYWIVMEAPASADAARTYVLWGGDSAAGYASGAGMKMVGTGAWAAEGADFYFRINGDELEDEVTAFARYDGDWYCAAGDTVYKLTAGAWATSERIAGHDVTALEAWGGYLWAARGAGDDVRWYNGTVWADATGAFTATLIKGGGGYLHRTGTGADAHKLYYSSNGTTWSSAIEVGPGDHAVTGLAWYRDILVLSTATRLWGMTAGSAYPLIDWHSQEDADNGRGLLAWSKTACLYIPLRFGLYRWNGDTMTAVGPEQGTGLPAERAGKIAALCATGNWLYAGVDAGTGRSSILAYSGRGGWHEVQRCEQTGQSILAVGTETLHSPSRLWFGMGSETRYLMMPDYSDNPWQWTGYEFNAMGELETSWIGGDLIEVVKDLHEVVIRGEGIGAEQPLEVYYEVDRSGTWTYLGRVTETPRQGLTFPTSTLGIKTVGTGSTRTVVELAAGSDTEDMAAGDWVRIGSAVRQVASITDSDTFTLETALDDAAEEGLVVYGSRAAGREFRFKLVMATSDRTETPLVKAVVVRYQNNVLDRYVYSLTVRVENGIEDLTKAAYPYTAKDLREELSSWATRVTPFYLVDPDGERALVKVVSAGEGGWERKEGQSGARSWSSVYSMNLVEIG